MDATHVEVLVLMNDPNACPDCGSELDDSEELCPDCSEDSGDVFDDEEF